MIHFVLLSVWLAIEIQESGSTAITAHSTIADILNSGRIATVAESPSQRVSTKKMIAPGLPPLLSFRYYEGRSHHRFGNTELVLDDAGH